MIGVDLTEGAAMELFAIVVEKLCDGCDLQILTYCVKFFKVERSEIFG